MKGFSKLRGANHVMIWGIALVMVMVAGVYLMPRGDAIGTWVYVKEAPVVQVGPFPVPNKSNTVVTIAGVGFEPKQELGIRIEMGGVMSDIRYQVKPSPVTDEDGAFASQWKLGRELRLMESGVHTLAIVDESGDIITHTPFVLAEAEKKKKK